MHKVTAFTVPRNLTRAAEALFVDEGGTQTSDGTV